MQEDTTHVVAVAMLMLLLHVVIDEWRLTKEWGRRGGIRRPWHVEMGWYGR
jgi:hypothetical protein